MRYAHYIKLLCAAAVLLIPGLSAALWAGPQQDEPKESAAKKPAAGDVFDEDSRDPKSKKDAEKPKPKLPPTGPSNIEIHDWGFWVLDTTIETGNSKDQYPSALPALVASPRSRAVKKGQTRLSPISIVTFHGESKAEMDLELRGDGAQFLAYWPKPEVKNQRLRWLSMTFTSSPKDAGLMAFVGPEEWFEKARSLGAEYLKYGARVDRFLAYDAEVRYPVPIRLEGGPDNYRLSNVGGEALYDVLVVAPSAKGVRLGWAAELVPDKAKADKAKKTPAVKPKAPEKAPATAETPNVAVKRAVRIRQGVAEDPTVASVASGRTAPIKPAGPGGPVVEAAMSPPLAPDSAELKQKGEAELVRRLVAAGLKQDEAELCVGMCAPAVFGGKDLLVVARLSQSAVEKLLPMEATPEAKRMVRTRLVLIRNLDPAADREVSGLIAKLGDGSYRTRESAEAKLLELGPIAWQGLKESLTNTDQEVVLRVERLLLKQNQTLEPPKKSDKPRPAAAPAAMKK